MTQLRLPPVLLAWVLVLGCAHSLTGGWAAPEDLGAPSPEAYPGQPAVYLLREHRIFYFSQWQGASYTQTHVHDVLAILRPSGFEYGNVRVPYPEKGRFIHFQARTLTEGGQAKDVEPSRVFDDTLLKSEEDGRSARVRVFAFPDVSVGSVLEYSYVLETPDVYGWDLEYISAAIPIRRYHLELQGTSDIIYSTRAYHTKGEWVQSSDGSVWVLRLDVQDVPAWSTEPWLAPARLREPWWLFRIAQFAKYGVTVPVNHTWADALRHRAEKMYFDHGDYYQGFDLKLDAPKCTDVPCKLTRALEQIDAVATLEGWGEWPGRPAQEVLTRGTGSGVERARLLFRLLSDAGIDVRFAVTNRAGSNLVDETAPYPNAFNHLVLFLPAQAGLPAERWLDPACVHCAIGQVPSWVEAAPALVLKARPRGLGERRSSVTADKIVITGEAAPPEAERKDHEIWIGANRRSISARLLVSRYGRRAQDARKDTRGWKDKDWLESSEWIAIDHLPVAKLKSQEPYRFVGQPVHAERVVELEAESYTYVDGDRIFVPLDVLKASFDELDTGEPRMNPIWIEHPRTSIETALIHAPEGCQADQLPKPKQLASGPFEVHFFARIEATGVRVQRTLRMSPGVHPLDAPAREVLGGFGAAARELVVFRCKTAAPSAH